MANTDDPSNSPDMDGEQDSSEKDRAAILARRKHFIALALSGLASAGVACDSNTSTPNSSGSTPGPSSAPEPCLEIAPAPREEEEGEQGDEAGAGGSDDPPPQACLKIAEPEPPAPDEPDETEPKVCLKIAPPDEQEDPPPKPEPAPRPCLRKANPNKTKPPPRPCLKTAPPDPFED